jgi:hypothetical protein
MLSFLPKAARSARSSLFSYGTFMLRVAVRVVVVVDPYVTVKV